MHSHDVPVKFGALPHAQRIGIASELARLAVIRWHMYLDKYGPYRYMEGVVGTFHTMEDSLPADAYAQSVGILGGQGTGVFSRPRLGWIGKRYQEPVVAMQDDDIELPSEVEYAYYAV
eukprot:TRINITY_DN1934_c0_g1_i6.p1 TRINITY_DN1934_c0_g1~~TRINITY_DN1934_c0_g1_i6.p1  ORF type:complete len:118 (+),score=12.19 TRINITY_DN1934_c0_g1_i6:78-431(+)